MMKTFYHYAFSMCACALAVTSCQDYDLGLTVEEIAYKKNFEKAFGKIDPEQNFNMAAQYVNLCNSRMVSATRATRTAPVGWTTTVGELQYISAAEVTDAQTYFPEGTFSPSNYAAANSYYISDGKPLYLRPIYSQTNSSNTIGVYNVDNPEEKLPIIAMNGDNWKQTSQNRSFGHVYEVNIPKGAKYGFYLSRSDGHTHYSEVSLNRANGIYSEYGTCQDCNITLAQGGAFLGFEDWGHNGGNEYDCNDMIFHVSPTLVDKVVKLDSWIVAFEDLGDVLDIDFNDVVLDVTHSGTDLIITPLAAGGTIPSDVYFKEGNSGEPHRLDEIHKMLTGTDDYTQPLNASSDNPTPGTPVHLTVSRDYNLAQGLANGDIYIVTNQTSYNLESNANSQVISSCTISGEAPKAIVVPSSWEWPTETCPITTAYPSFSKWVSDATYDVWITDKKPGSFVKRITATIQEEQPVAPNEDPNYVEGKGILVSLTTDATNGDCRFINPSYFKNANEMVKITIEESTSHYFETVIEGPGFTKVVLSRTSSATITDDNLTAAKMYGVEIQQYTNGFDWSSVNVYVMIDGAVGGDDNGNNDDDGGSSDGDGDNGNDISKTNLSDGQPHVLEASIIDNGLGTYKYFISFDAYSCTSGSSATILVSPANNLDSNGIYYNTNWGKDGLTAGSIVDDVKTFSVNAVFVEQMMNNGLYLPYWGQPSQTPAITITFIDPS